MTLIAHHAGEELILTAAIGSGLLSGWLIVVWRTRLGRLVDRMKRR